MACLIMGQLINTGTANTVYIIAIIVLFLYTPSHLNKFFNVGFYNQDQSAFTRHQKTFIQYYQQSLVRPPAVRVGQRIKKVIHRQTIGDSGKYHLGNKKNPSAPPTPTSPRSDKLAHMCDSDRRCGNKDKNMSCHRGCILPCYLQFSRKKFHAELCSTACFIFALLFFFCSCAATVCILHLNHIWKVCVYVFETGGAVTSGDLQWEHFHTTKYEKICFLGQGQKSLRHLQNNSWRLLKRKAVRGPQFWSPSCKRSPHSDCVNRPMYPQSAKYQAVHTHTHSPFTITMFKCILVYCLHLGIAFQ